MINVKIKTLGAYVPSKKVTSNELEKQHGISEGWIASHTGVETRPYFTTESIVQAGAYAASDAIKNAGLVLTEIDCLIVASASKHNPLPCTASFLKKELGASHDMACFDIDSTCLSFVTAFDNIAYAVDAGKYKNVLIVSSECPSKACNWEQKESAALFGDVAVAAIISKTEENETSKIIFSKMNTYTEGIEYARIKGGTAGYPADQYCEETRKDFLFHMDGKRIYKVASKYLPQMFYEALEESNLKMEDLKMVIFHQASLLSLQLIQAKLKIPDGKMKYIIQEYGNNVAASIPMALKVSIDEGEIKRGDKVMFVGTSAGLSIGVMIFEY